MQIDRRETIILIYKDHLADFIDFTALIKKLKQLKTKLMIHFSEFSC